MNYKRFFTRLPYLFSSALMGTIASYIIYIHISKDLNFEDFGKISYWMSLGAIFTVLFDLGINQYLQVNYAKDIRSLSECLLGLKVILGLIVTSILFLLFRDILLIFFLTSFWWVSFQAFFSYYLRLQQKFFLDIVFNLAYYTVFVVVFLYLLKSNEMQPSSLFAWSHFAMRLLLFFIIGGFFLFGFKQKVRIFNLLNDWDLLGKVMGFSLLSVLIVSMQNVDSLILYKKIESAALFSKVSMVIKIGFLNYAFFDSFITLASASELKSEQRSAVIFSNQFKTCLGFGIIISLGIHIMTLLLPMLVGEKWSGLSEISTWAIVNNIAIYVFLYFQFKLLSLGKVKAVASAILCFIIGSSLISYFFASYQTYFILSALLKILMATYFIIIYKRIMQPLTGVRLQYSNIA